MAYWVKKVEEYRGIQIKEARTQEGKFKYYFIDGRGDRFRTLGKARATIDWLKKSS
jgi:hypothetical protein